jgi:hypothetical protein
VEPVVARCRLDRRALRPTLPLADPSWCNDQGHKYPGPSVAVVDANTIPPMIFSLQVGWITALVHFSVDQATGADGANVWTRADLMNGNKDLLGSCTDMLR